MIRLKLEIIIQSYLQLSCTYDCIIYSFQFRKQSQMDLTQTHLTFGPPILSSVSMGYLPRLLREITFQSSSEYEGFPPSFLQPTRPVWRVWGSRKRDKRNITLKSKTFQANFILQSHLNTLLAKMLPLLLQPFQAAEL